MATRIHEDDGLRGLALGMSFSVLPDDDDKPYSGKQYHDDQNGAVRPGNPEQSRTDSTPDRRRRASGPSDYLLDLGAGASNLAGDPFTGVDYHRIAAAMTGHQPGRRQS
jgi:hypothetical protein